MGKKHFNDMASRLKVTKPADESPYSYQQWKLMLLVMADFCLQNNDKFDRDRFLTACGLYDA